jgi:hypothetical protein
LSLIEFFASSVRAASQKTSSLIIMGMEGAQFDELARDLEMGAPGARERIEVLVLASNAFSAAGSSRVLADYKCRRGLFQEALRAANSGLTRLATARAKGKLADEYRAGLTVERGLAFAGLGQVDQALAVHDELGKTYPAYAHLAVGRFRICFLAATRVGEFPDALQIFQMRKESLVLDPRELFMGSVLQAVEGESEESERTRLAEKIRTDQMLSLWLRVAAPGLEAELLPRIVPSISGAVPKIGLADLDPDSILPKPLAAAEGA